MLLFEVNKQMLKRVDAIEPATDSEQYLKAKFTFKDADWNGKVRTAFFRLGDVVYKALLNSNNECVVPSEVLVHSESRYAKTHGSKFFVSLVGEYSTTRITTNEVQIDLNASGYSDAEEPKKPTESEYQQILTQYANNEAAINEAKAECENARADLVGVKNIFANAIKGKLSGAVVSADDVSPVEHNPIVKVHGKNLFITDVNKYNKPSSYHVCPIDLKKGHKYCLSGSISGAAISGIVVSVIEKGEHYEDFVSSMHTLIWADSGLISPITFEVDENWTSPKLAIYTTNGKEGLQQIFDNYNLQLEEGSTATGYEPYLDPSTMTVRRYGKNLVDLSGFEFNDSNYTHSYYQTDETANALYEFLKHNTGKNIMMSVKTTGNPSGVGIGQIRFFSENDTLICAIFPNVLHTIIELPDTFTNCYVYGSTTGASTSKFQIEFGEVVTGYEEPNITQHTPSADGTVEGITSLSPNMTILTDTEGAIVECEYIKDTNKVLQKLADALNITI